MEWLIFWCYFPIALVKNHHKLRGLTQMYHFTLLEAQNQKWILQGWNLGVSRIALPLEASGKNSFSCLFLLLKATCIPWLTAPSTLFTASSTGSSPFLTPALLSHLPLTLMPPSYKESCNSLSPHRWYRFISPAQEPWINHRCKVPFTVQGNIFTISSIFSLPYFSPKDLSSTKNKNHVCLIHCWTLTALHIIDAK